MMDKLFVPVGDVDAYVRLLERLLEVGEDRGATALLLSQPDATLDCTESELAADWMFSLKGDLVLFTTRLAPDRHAPSPLLWSPATQGPIRSFSPAVMRRVVAHLLDEIDCPAPDIGNDPWRSIVDEVRALPVLRRQYDVPWLHDRKRRFLVCARLGFALDETGSRTVAVTVCTRRGRPLASLGSLDGPLDRAATRLRTAVLDMTTDKHG